MDEAKQAERSPTEGRAIEAQVNETKITSVEKAKDPKRVEAGKKLGAMSKQAKEKKASQRIEIEDEFKVPSIDSIASLDPLAVVGVLGVVGVIVYYKYFSKKKSEDNKSDNPTPQEEKPKQAERAERKKLDSLD